MNSFINMLPEAASLGRAKCLARAIALASTVGVEWSHRTGVAWHLRPRDHIRNAGAGMVSPWRRDAQ